MNIRTSMLIIAVVELMATALGNDRVSTAVYAGRHFELRDQDQPVKYVFNAETRVARVTGSLSENTRIQRFRLHTGWNLCAIAVDGARLFTDVEIVSAYRWDSVTQDYATVAAAEELRAGSVVWIKASANVVASMQGIYVEPGLTALSDGGGYMAGAGLEIWPMQLPPGVIVWRFDAANNRWHPTHTEDLAPLSAFPPRIAPGEAIYVHTREAVDFAMPEPTRRIAYYHQDHLGSSSVITDAGGEVVEETAYYPFGASRHSHRAGGVDAHYSFTQKERDAESRLHYFEARYLAGPLGRFISFDPMIKRLEALEADELKNFLAQPAKLNPFVYALNNPVRYVDPDGREARPRRTQDRGPRSDARRQRQGSGTQRPDFGAPASEQPEPDLTIRVGAVSKPGEIDADSFTMDPHARRRTLSGAPSGSARDERDVTDFSITRDMDKVSTDLFRKSQQGLHIKSVLVIMPGKDGSEVRIHLKDVYVESVQPSTHLGRPMASITFNAGSMRFGDEAPPPPSRRSEWDLGASRGQ